MKKITSVRPLAKKLRTRHLLHLSSSRGIVNSKHYQVCKTSSNKAFNELVHSKPTVSLAMDPTCGDRTAVEFGKSQQPADFKNNTLKEFEVVSPN